MALIALSLDRRAEDALLPGALAAGHSVAARVQTAGELGAALAAHPIDLAVVSASRTRLTAQTRVAAVATGARLVVIADSADEREVARAAGAATVLALPESWARLDELLRAPVAFPPAAGEDGPRASVIAVWGPTGAPGRTSLAIAIAAELAECGAAVLLADADSYGGAVAPMLGLLDETPGFAAACRLAGADELTRAELDRVAQFVPTAAGSLAVLTGLARPSRWPELGEARVAATLTAVGGWFDHVVVDVGFNLETDEEIASDLFAPHRNAATLATLAAASELVCVGRADVVGVSRLLRGLDEARALAADAHHHVVLNRVRAAAVGAAPDRGLAEALERFGGVRAAALVPDDPAAFDAALRDGGPLPRLAPHSPARAAVRAFVAEALLGLPAEPVPRRRIRPFRRRPQTAEPVATGPAPPRPVALDWHGVDPQ